MYATLFLLIFAAALVLYGFALKRTGSIDLMPYRTQHTIRGPEDVRYAGAIVMRIGAILAAILLLVLTVMRLAL